MRGATQEETERFLAECARLKVEAERISPFKRWQLVRITHPAGLSFGEDGLKSIEREEDDPHKYSDSRVVSWDPLGRVNVALPYHDNPHHYEWCWSDDHVTPIERDDWFNSSSFKIGDNIRFQSEIRSWKIQIGDVAEATLLGPHIEVGDWIIDFKDIYGTRVLNESAMLR